MIYNIHHKMDIYALASEQLTRYQFTQDIVVEEIQGR
jgi:hypothetical protein